MTGRRSGAACPGPARLLACPWAMFFQVAHALLPGLFRVPGMTCRFRQKTNKSVVHRGVECMAAETCYPVKGRPRPHSGSAGGRGLGYFSCPASSIFATPIPKSNRVRSVRGPTPFLYRPIHHRFFGLWGEAAYPGDLFRLGRRVLRRSLQSVGKSWGSSWP